MSRMPWRAACGWSSKVEDNAQREGCRSDPKGGGGQPFQSVVVTVGVFVGSGVGASKVLKHCSVCAFVMEALHAEKLNSEGDCSRTVRRTGITGWTTFLMVAH